jgi:hypothetical protein
MNPQARHDGLPPIRNEQEKRTDRKRDEGHEDDGRERGDGGCRFGIRVKPVRQGRQEASNVGEARKSAKDRDGEDL